MTADKKLMLIEGILDEGEWPDCNKVDAIRALIDDDMERYEMYYEEKDNER
jgi:hypothetical protein